jgi:hypothetical protein
VTSYATPAAAKRAAERGKVPEVKPTRDPYAKAEPEKEQRRG